VRRGGRKKPVHRGITFGKPKTAGVLGRKLVKNARAVAESSPSETNSAMCAF